MSDERRDPPVTRRGFLEGTGALLGGALLARSLDGAPAAAAGPGAVLSSDRADADYDLIRPENQILTSCLQCNTGCGIRCKIRDGVVVKIDGNPYSPFALAPHLPAAVAPQKAAAVDGAICPKGQAGMQTVYDPYRLRVVLKRAGRRGENRWVTIPFERAIEEICEGGRLFAQVPGEERREVEGLRSLVALRDAAVAKRMAEDVAAIWAEKDPARKTDRVAAFRRDHAAWLDRLIDPAHPDLGPRNNQIALVWGRMKGGRTELYRRLAAALGTVNAHGHTTVCQGSLYFTSKAVGEQYVGGKFQDGAVFYWQADLDHAEFVLFVGANLFAANYGPPNRSARLAGRLAEGRTRIAVVDPRCGPLAAKAWRWLPIRPGMDGALAMAFLRWMLDHERFDRTFLACANKAAARAAGETNWTNATWLVEVKDGRPGRFVRAADVRDADGRPLVDAEPRTLADGKTYEEKFLLVESGGRLVPVDPNDEEHPVVGELFVDRKLPDGTTVKSALQLLREEVGRRTVAEWAELAGLRADDVVEVAQELTAHGRRAAVDIHRGVSQHTNGFYNVLAWMTVNLLLGNYNARGGMVKASAWSFDGKKAGPYDLTAHPGKVPSFGVSLIRHGVDYEKTTLFDGYPARRNWYPLCSDVYEEILPSIGDAYPYPIKALFLYMAAPTYSLPGGQTNISVLLDTEKLPLVVACDILVGPTSMYADYIFPDLSYLERWEFQGSQPNIVPKIQPVRQPAIPPVPGEVTVFGRRMPLGFEAMVLAIAERLQLPGFGPGGLGRQRGTDAPLDLCHPDDYYLRAMANLAFGEKEDGSQAVPDASAEEMELFLRARRHLPPSVFDPERWRSLVGDSLWPKVVHLLNRGGRFEVHEAGWRNDRIAHPYGGLLNLYQEKTAETRHAGTGEPNPGLATWVPARDFSGRPLDSLAAGYPLALVTHRVISRTKSRTAGNPWLAALLPENGFLLHPADAERLGLRDGQAVRVVSASNHQGHWNLGPSGHRPMIGRVVVTETIRPGVTSFALGFGLWGAGAEEIRVDGVTIPADPRRARGVHANAAMWTDPALPNTCCFDPVGGSVSFYDTFVRLEAIEG